MKFFHQILYNFINLPTTFSHLETSNHAKQGETWQEKTTLFPQYFAWLEICKCPKILGLKKTTRDIFRVPLYRVEFSQSIDSWLDKFERTKGPLTIMKSDEFRDKSINTISNVRGLLKRAFVCHTHFLRRQQGKRNKWVWNTGGH